MCGFFAIVYPEDREDLGKILVNAAHRLSYRGYDSVGAFVLKGDGRWELRKDTGKVEEVNEKLKLDELSGRIGLVQLRWATFGVPAKRNAQPHKDCDGMIFGAHNGNVINSPRLREELKAKGHEFLGENDGEVVIHVVEEKFKETGDMVKAIIESAKVLKGDYAYAILKKDENRVFAVKKGASLFLGVGKGFMCASSDQVSILEHTKDIVPLKDWEFVEFGVDYYILRSLKTGKIIEREPMRSTLSPENAQKQGYPHFMIKEINEQPIKARELIHLMEEYKGYDLAVEKILKARRIYVVGSGTSYHAALLGSYYAAKIAEIEFLTSIAAEFPERHLDTVKRGDLLIAVSQSGETKDVIHCVDLFEEKTGKTGDFIGIINVRGSSLALRSGVLLPIASDLEISVPATKTFINQVLIFLNLARKIREKKGLSEVISFKEIEKVPELLKKSIEMTEPLIKKLIDRIGFSRTIHILGYGITFPIALEGALKVKEVVYENSEGMHSGEFKHGPLAIVEPGYPVIFVSTKKDKEMVLSHIHEVKTRRGFVITIAPEDEDLKKSSDFFIRIPDSSYYLTPVLAVVPLQLLAYHWSVTRGINPDFPKNISKTLTVF